MATTRYTFRPNLFVAERTIVLDGSGIAVQIAGRPDRRVPWAEIEEVHIEPATSGEDGRARWLINLKVASGRPIQVDSVNVRGTADFEHKTEAFVEVLRAVHAGLVGRTDVRYRFGARRGVIIAWRIALVMVAAAGIFGVVAAIVTEDYEAVFYGAVFVAFGVAGLAALKGRGGPRPYDPSGFALEPEAGPQT